MREILLPSLGAEMEEGTLLEWHVAPGDHIEYGDVIALLDTEKAEIEMQAFESGTIEALLVGPGETVAVGTPIARLTANAEATDARDEAAPAAPTPASASGQRVRATPLARRIARERGIDLAGVAGSGPGGAIVEADVPQTSTGTPAQAPPPVPSPGSKAKREAPTRNARRREIIAAAMTRSKREIPHYYLSTPIEVHETLDWLENHNRDRSIDERILLPALLIKAVARAARDFPDLNGHWLEDGFHPAESVHLGMVVSLRTGGIIVPTLRDAAERSVLELMAELRDVVGRARAGRLRSGELGEATISLTSLGDRGAETIFGVIYPPQVAIVGFGGVHPGFWSENGLHGTRPVIRATLSADHRASDGQLGSRFLEAIARSLSEPENA